MQNKAKEEFNQGNNRKIKEKEEEDNGKYVELKRTKEILNKNIENLTEVLKTYLDEDLKISNIKFNLLKDESKETYENDHSELEEKVKYLMISLSKGIMMCHVCNWNFPTNIKLMFLTINYKNINKIFKSQSQFWKKSFKFRIFKL